MILGNLTQSILATGRDAVLTVDAITTGSAGEDECAVLVLPADVGGMWTVLNEVGRTWIASGGVGVGSF